MEIRNLTPHAVHVYDDDGSLAHSFHPSGVVAKIGTAEGQIHRAAGIPFYSVTYTAPEGLPNQEDNVLLLVSGMLRQALPGRKDLVSPGLLMRNPEDGQPFGCRGLYVNY